MTSQKMILPLSSSLRPPCGQKHRNAFTGTSHPCESTRKLGNPLKSKRRLTVILSCRQKSYCGGWAVAEAPGKHSQQGRAPRAGLNLVFSEESLLQFWVTVLFPVQFGGRGAALTQGGPLTPGHLRPSPAHVCCSSKLAAHNTPYARDAACSAPFNMLGEPVLQDSWEQTLHPRGSWGREGPQHRTCVPSSPAGAAHRWETTILIWPSCLNGAHFFSPPNSPAQGWDTPLLRPTPLSLSSVTKKNICTRLLMS